LSCPTASLVIDRPVDQEVKRLEVRVEYEDHVCAAGGILKAPRAASESQRPDGDAGVHVEVHGAGREQTVAVSGGEVTGDIDNLRVVQRAHAPKEVGFPKMCGLEPNGAQRARVAIVV